MTPSTRANQLPHRQRRYSTPPRPGWRASGGSSATGHEQRGQVSSVMRPACCNASVHFNPYGGSGAQVAAALVNLTGPAAVLATLREHGMAVTAVTPDEAVAIMAWRERLREVFAESDVD